MPLTLASDSRGGVASLARGQRPSAEDAAIDYDEPSFERELFTESDTWEDPDPADYPQVTTCPVTMPNPAVSGQHIFVGLMMLTTFCGFGSLERSDEDVLHDFETAWHAGVPTLDEIRAAYGDFPEDQVEENMAYWTTMWETVSRQKERVRRVRARLPLLLCRNRYYSEKRDATSPDVVVELARPEAAEGVFRHMCKYL